MYKLTKLCIIDDAPHEQSDEAIADAEFKFICRLAFTGGQMTCRGARTVVFQPFC